ncbi:MAG: protein adenylyltransferase SelO [Formosimonas sp.]
MKLNFDNQLTRELPRDPQTGGAPRQVHGACWSAVQPTPVAQPQLLAHSSDVATALGLSESDVRSDEFAQVFAGNRLLDGMQPYATCYGGHQFGHWAGQLGDGRAISLGEVLHNGQRMELQLKGAGPTPYSRTADGRAVLRSSIREFLCSEAMHHLGVPTTRALSLIATGDAVVRDMFYDGNAQAEAGAIVCRVAQSFTRFGQFELFAQRGDTDLLRQLVDFTLRRDYPQVDGDFAAWFKLVCERTAHLMVEWLRVGFVHGVMNTDNMSIMGLTIDYGPYGWMDNLDFGWTPNTTDAAHKRYAFGRQAGVARWNLHQLAQSLISVAPSQNALLDGLAHFDAVYQQQLQTTLAAKLGFLAWQDSDMTLVNDLFAWMQRYTVDYTELFRSLANGSDLSAAFYEPLTPEAQAEVNQWLQRYQTRLDAQNDSGALRRQRMNAVNPRFVLRNYLSQLAIDAAEQGDLKPLHDLQRALLNPYDEQSDLQHLYAKRPDWAKSRAGCSMLSCSS